MSQPDLKKLFHALTARNFDFNKSFMQLSPYEMLVLAQCIQETLPQYSLPYLKFMNDGTQVLCVPADAPPEAQWWNGSEDGKRIMKDLLTQFGATPQTMAAYGCMNQDEVPF